MTYLDISEHLRYRWVFKENRLFVLNNKNETTTES